MGKVDDLLNSRFKNDEKNSAKIKELATLSNTGALSSFAGVFRVNPLSSLESEELRLLLENYRKKGHAIEKDLAELTAVTSEIKAISNQAAVLHGERIAKAQELLKRYREGAFTAWLLAAYGNRQTPYNFLHYYLLYASLSSLLQKKMDLMPRQALYALAMRHCSQKEKEHLIAEYQGETKEQLLVIIREKFPLPKRDRRASSSGEQILRLLNRVEDKLLTTSLSPKHKLAIAKALKSIQKLL